MSVAPRILGIDVSCGGCLVGAMMSGMKVIGALESSAKDIECLTSNGIPCYLFEDPMDFSAVARTDVIFCCNRGPSSMDRLRAACRALSPRVLVVEGWQDLPLKVMEGFVEYRDVLSWDLLGCPIEDARTYVVAFKEDMKPPCRFPFPDSIGTEVLPKLDKAPSSGLFLSPKEIESVRNRETRNRKKGFRFGHKHLVKGKKCPRIPQGFYLYRHAVLVDDDNGMRRLSVPEIMRMMGMPDGWKLPSGIHDSYRMASTTSPTPVIKALLDELMVWIG